MNDWIMVVDDDTSNLRMASHILTAEQMRVSCLKSGEDAIRFFGGQQTGSYFNGYSYARNGRF